MTNIAWLRRDLQLHDNSSIHKAGRGGAPVQPVFVFDSEILAHFPNKRDRRVSFLANAVIKLHEELKAKNSQMLVFYGKSAEIVPQLANTLNAQIFAGEDYEPSTISRDAAVAKQCNLHLSLQHLLLSPTQISKDDGTAYKVFTPYSKAFLAAASDADYLEFNNSGVRYAPPQALENLRPLNLNSAAEICAQIGYEYVPDEQWNVANGQKMLDLFVAEKLAHYAAKRDFPAIYGTSRLSPYLRFGLVTPRQAFNAARHVEGSYKWIAELIWREFYAMILARFPHSISTEFQEQYRGLQWVENAEWFERWQAGQTGYPLVDAGMRELRQTGWMHNRMRMVVASFLTKNLLIDWRLGEAHFARHLMDYELASNVGGWQWASSTGTDAAPYFRMFSPISQSKRFDPEGEYIRRYVPELELLPTKDLHEPWLRARPTNYPAPIVNHAESREKVMAFFKR